MNAQQSNDEATEQDMTRKILRRRGLMAGAAALTVGLLAKQAEPASAAFGSMTLDTDNTTILNTNIHGPGGTKPWVSASGNSPVLSVLNTNNDCAIAAKGTVGVYGESPNSTGVWGSAANGAAGVFGSSNGGAGLYGISSSGYAVYAQSQSGAGVHAITNSGQYGVSGFANGAVNAAGVYGSSGTGYGVLGTTSAPGYSGLTGLVSTANTAAVVGTSTVPGAFAAYFTGAVVVNGSFTVLDPTQKHGAIAHPDGSHRLLYSMESPESWLEDFGKGKIVGGRATVKLDADFAAVVQTDDYHVFLTEYDDHNALFVTKQTATGFEVHAKGSTSASSAFGYRVVAKPKTEKKVERLGKFTVPNLKTAAPSDFPKPPEPTKRPDRSQ